MDAIREQLTFFKRSTYTNTDMSLFCRLKLELDPLFPKKRFCDCYKIDRNSFETWIKNQYSYLLNSRLDWMIYTIADNEAKIGGEEMSQSVGNCRSTVESINISRTYQSIAYFQ
jgi:hypothetical protein